VTDNVPWGYVCGYPTNRGDLYGGGHYLVSATATLTKQGKAIYDTARRFAYPPGSSSSSSTNANTLPFTPMMTMTANKDGSSNSNRRVACPFHEKARRKRLASENGVFRRGEVNSETTFWNRGTTEQADWDKDGSITTTATTTGGTNDSSMKKSHFSSTIRTKEPPKVPDKDTIQSAAWHTTHDSSTQTT
jgi:hypothetical protein